MAPIKGDAVRFIAGKYGGKTGWLNANETADDRVVPVIVDQGRGKGEKATWVEVSSVRTETNAAPTCYAEAVIQQCPDIERSLVTVTRQLAKCDIRRDVSGFQRVITNKIDEAVGWQEKRGSKALYRKINYEG